MNNEDLVYSTDPNWKKKKMEHPQGQGAKQGPIYIQREKKGRAGKTVTTISNMPGDLKSILRDLKKYCGSGGTVRQNILEIQGDQRNKIAQFLSERGLKVKFRGG